MEYRESNENNKRLTLKRFEKLLTFCNRTGVMCEEHGGWKVIFNKFNSFLRVLGDLAMKKNRFELKH